MQTQQQQNNTYKSGKTITYGCAPPLHPTQQLCFLSCATSLNRNATSQRWQARQHALPPLQRWSCYRQKEGVRGSKLWRSKFCFYWRSFAATGGVTDWETERHKESWKQSKGCSATLGCSLKAVEALSHLNCCHLQLGHTLTLSYQWATFTEYKAQLPARLHRTTMMTMMLGSMHSQMSVSHYGSADVRHSRLQRDWVDFITFKRGAYTVYTHTDIRVTYSIKQLHCPTADPTKYSNLCVSETHRHTSA